MGKSYKQSDMWVVELDEGEWYSPKVNQDALIRDAEWAARNKKCSVLAIFVTPDILFSTLENKRKHRVFHKLFDTGTESFKVTLLVTGEIDHQLYTATSEKDRVALIRQVRDQVNLKARGAAGRYVIMTSDGLVLEQGRV